MLYEAISRRSWFDVQFIDVRVEDAVDEANTRTFVWVLVW